MSATLALNEKIMLLYSPHPHFDLDSRMIRVIGKNPKALRDLGAWKHFPSGYAGEVQRKVDCPNDKW